MVDAAPISRLPADPAGAAFRRVLPNPPLQAFFILY
jgi:hypothetical protein